MRRVPAVAGLLWLCASAALAQPPGGVNGRGVGSLLAQALVSLGVVVGIVYATHYGLRRLSNRQMGAESGGPMEILQARHLGGDRWLYLVAVENRRIIVGGSTGQLQQVADLGDTTAMNGDTDERPR